MSPTASASPARRFYVLGWSPRETWEPESRAQLSPFKGDATTAQVAARFRFRAFATRRLCWLRELQEREQHAKRKGPNRRGSRRQIVTCDRARSLRKSPARNPTPFLCHAPQFPLACGSQAEFFNEAPSHNRTA